MKTYGDMAIGTVFHILRQGNNSTYMVSWRDEKYTYMLRFGQTGAVPFPNKDWAVGDLSVLMIPGQQTPEAAWRFVGQMAHGPRVTNAVRQHIPSLGRILDALSAQVS